MDRYKINRIGVLNYWLYDEEEFYFYDGKLLLRGTNGSGKSVTMVSFFPLLFDGNKNPERLDTFGSRDRKIEDYVLPSTFEGNENTSYLYMEFYNKEKDKYLTIGIGLRAIRNRNVEFYGFAITDNRRIKQDFMLYKDSLRKIPLTKRELQIEIGSGGHFVTSTKEYKAMVNNLLFGFENESIYTELINLMLQLRSPKLSKDYKPTKLEEILSGVLEPLNERDIATMSESIENMNKYKEKINDLTSEYSAITGLLHSFKDYSDMILYNKANAYKTSNQNYENAKRKKIEEEKNIKTLEEQIALEEKRSNEIKIDLSDIEYKIGNLDAKDLNKLLEEKLTFEKEKADLKAKKDSKEMMLESKDTKRCELENKVRETEQEAYEQEKNYQKKFRELEELSSELYYDEIYFYLDELKEKKNNFKFNLLIDSLDKEKTELNNLLTYIKEKEAIKDKKDIEEERIAKQEEDIKGLEKNKKELTNLLVEEIERLKGDISSLRENKVFYLSEETQTNIIEILESLDSHNAYKISTLLKDSYQEIKNNINKKILLLNQKIESEKNNITTLENDKTKVDAILESNLEFSETKKYLEENGIKAKYLYEVIEFKNDITPSLKKIIEKALKRMGILQTFLIKTSNTNLDIKTFNKIPKEKDSLLKYFNIIDKEYEKEALEVLESISTKEGLVGINEDGSYYQGLIKGKVNEEYELKYIGKDTRENYINELLENIDKLIDNHQNIITELETNVEESDNDLVLLDEEYDNCLNVDHYSELIEELQGYDIKIELINKNIKELIERISILESEIAKIDALINSEKKYFKGPLNSKDLSEVIVNYDIAKETSLIINNILSSYQNKKEILETHQNSLEEITDSIIEIKLEIDNLNLEQEKLTRKINQIDSQVSSDKFKNIKEELEKLTAVKQLLEREKETNLINITTHKKELEIARENLNELNDKENMSLKEAKVTKRIFDDEYNLKYSNYTEEIEDFNKWFKNFKIAKIFTPTESAVRFLESMNNYLPKLQNYAGRKIDILNYDTTDENDKNIASLLNEAKRIDLEFRYSGKNLNLILLDKAIYLELETTKSLLNEEDRKLFEDLLMNNIGDSIRSKIASSNEWIKEVRGLMESMNTSSGLTFSVRWIGKGKETEEELDTKEIVDIFERDPKTLKDEDLQKITDHFRSKITLEEEKYEESERNYLEIIRNVLDYRKWYEFKLYFKRADQDKKELTDKEFSKFSGGEKAIAMYIPLFAGIYAKFNSAKNDAPRVIALDEAFAGVDDDNILDCFRIMNEMDLDYILTSQILWGDYSSIKHLAICELHHLPTSNVVSIIRYKWDGLKRSLVTDNKEYQS